MSNIGNVGGAYGAGKAGAPFDPIAFIKKPQVILRLCSMVFSIIVFGCIASGGWHRQGEESHCIMNDDANACGYGTGIGVIAFLACIIFLVLDAMFDNLSSVQHRKYVVIADIVFSGFWAFLWFVGFCYLCDAWRRTPEGHRLPWQYPTDRGKNDVQAAIAFSFFSIFTWAAQAALAVRKYRLGAQDAFTTGYDTDPNAASSPYSSFPGSETGEPYQQPPFATQKEAPDFSQPTY
ncbi:synaptogyrin-1-like [Liolophura sinensis]|uniref:synaptogyrin-1-like n=1 Tax=Liolophura sinensis TaxID=3198878 RepID=UPI0031593D07